MPIPAAGTLRLGNATQNAATVVRADLLDTSSADWTTRARHLRRQHEYREGRDPHLQDGRRRRSGSTSTSLRVATPAGYRNITVSNTGELAASPFSNADALTADLRSRRRRRNRAVRIRRRPGRRVRRSPAAHGRRRRVSRRHRRLTGSLRSSPRGMQGMTGVTGAQGVTGVTGARYDGRGRPTGATVGYDRRRRLDRLHVLDHDRRRRPRQPARCASRNAHQNTGHGHPCRPPRHSQPPTGRPCSAPSTTARTP